MDKVEDTIKPVVPDQKSDFLPPGEGQRSLLESDTVRMHTVKKNLDFLRITSDNVRGQLLKTISLDPAFDSTSAAMASEYEYWRIKSFEINIEATSPMGTSSGAAQVAYIQDPQNANFDATGTEFNISKAVRQEGSVIVRPRESVQFYVRNPNTLYTLSGSDPRFSSFGNIVFVVRDKPYTGDSCSLVVSLHAVLEFIRTTKNSNTYVVPSLYKAKFESTKEGIIIDVAETIPGSDGAKAIFNGGLHLLVSGIGRRNEKRLRNVVLYSGNLTTVSNTENRTTFFMPINLETMELKESTKIVIQREISQVELHLQLRKIEIQ